MRALLLVALMSGPLFAKTTNDLLKIGLTQEFENLNPLIGMMSVTSYIYSMANRPLVALNDEGKWVPRLALRIPSLENGAAKLSGKGKNRKLQATWEIHPQAKWGDGTPVTGHDARFTWQVGMNKNVAVATRKFFEIIEDVKVDSANPKKFTIVYKEAKWDFYRANGFNLLPKHLEEAVFKKFGSMAGGYEKNSLYTTNPTHPGLYCGPYLVSELKLGSHVVLVPNKRFYGKRPKIKRIILKLIPNTATLESNIRSGNIDMISMFGMSLDQALIFEKKVKREKLPLRVNFKPAMVYEHIDLRLDNPILQDLRVRRALLHALDRKKLSRALFEGKQPPALHNVTPSDPWYTDDAQKIVHYKSSRKKARELLERAGWKKGKGGYRYKDGKKLSFQLMTTSGNKLREIVQVFLQNQWKKVGVEITIKNEPPRVFFGETVRKGKFPSMAMFAWLSLPETDFTSQYHSKYIPTAKNGWTGSNAPKWKNKEVDKILDQMGGEFDFKKRKALAQRFLYHYTNDVPVLPLYYRSTISVVPKNMRGYQPSGTSFSPTLYVENWEFM